MAKGRGGKRVDWQTKELIVQQVEAGVPMAAIARRLGVDRSTVFRHYRMYQSSKATGGTGPATRPPALGPAKTERDVPPPLTVAQLAPEDLALLDDFPAFRRRFFHVETPWHQEELARIAGDDSEPAQIVLIQPGSGKTTTLSFSWIIWQITRARARGEWFSCLYVSKSDELAGRHVSRVRRFLESSLELQLAYGRFKPKEPLLWTRDQLLVEGFEGFEEKDPTLAACGARSAVYGIRVTLMIVDDLVDKELAATPQITDKLQEWFQEELESRINSGGRLVVVGTRFTPWDLYGRLLAMRSSEDDEPMYKLTTFPAHDPARCRLPEGVEDCTCKGPCVHHPAQPDGCTLWPDRYYWRPRRATDHRQALKLIREKMGNTRFDFVYNQISSPEGSRLVTAAVLEAAHDRELGLWQLPRQAAVICTLDPTGARGFASAQVWAYDRSEDLHTLVALHRDHMNMPDYLRLIEAWTTRLRALGAEPVWVLEQNMLQFLLQSSDWANLKSRLGGLRVVLHQTTGKNKWDPELGVPMIGPVFEAARIRLPWRDPEARRATQYLTDELLIWPDGTTDCVMAMWFYLAHVHKLAAPSTSHYVSVPGLPPYLAQRRQVYNLNRPTALGAITIDRRRDQPAV